MDALAPRIDEAQQNKGDYSQFYTNPAGMGSASMDPKVGAFVNRIYENRQKFDLSENGAFGSKCLEKDADGKCTRWSTAKDLITNTYKDCEKVMIPTYDDPPAEATCSGSNQITTTACEVTSYVNILTEDISVACDQLTYTYHCGGTGGVKSYQVAYNCLGEIRCMGTERIDASYQANQDLAKVAAAMEVLNQYRADSTQTEIFPGEVQTCQKSPKTAARAPGD